MSPDQNDSPSLAEQFPDLAAEPRDCANQWDMSAVWPDDKPEPRPDGALPEPAPDDASKA